MARILRTASEEENENADFDDGISTHYSAWQISTFDKASKPNEKAVEPPPIAAKIEEARANIKLWQNLKEILKRDGTITVNKTELLCR